MSTAGKRKTWLPETTKSVERKEIRREGESQKHGEKGVGGVSRGVEGGGGGGG